VIRMPKLITVVIKKIGKFLGDIQSCINIDLNFFMYNDTHTQIHTHTHTYTHTHTHTYRGRAAWRVRRSEEADGALPKLLHLHR
jgi:hypothetical protein